MINSVHIMSSLSNPSAELPSLEDIVFFENIFRFSDFFFKNLPLFRTLLEIAASNIVKIYQLEYRVTLLTITFKSCLNECICSRGLRPNTNYTGMIELD